MKNFSIDMKAARPKQTIPVPLPFQTPGEEIANAVSHGAGVLLAVTGLVLLVLQGQGYFNIERTNPLKVLSSLIFMITMISMFLTSTLYHAIPYEKAKRIFRILDHSAIYIFIAGSYTPFCLLGIKGTLGWVCFGIEWILAAIGILLYSLNCRFFKKAELAVYLLMGWAIVVSWFRLVSAIPVASLILLVSGGIAYTLGTLWYAKPTRRGAHVIWHIFVLIGAIGHWWSIWFIW
jgi:hemolysin III